MADDNAWPEGVGFMDRAKATMDLKQAIKVGGLSDADLPHTSAEQLENDCLKSARSKDEYLRLIDQNKKAYMHKGNVASLETTTGTSESSNDVRTIGKFKGIYHAESLNSMVYRQVHPESTPKAVLKVVHVTIQQPPHDINNEAEFMKRIGSDAPHVIALLSREMISGGSIALRLPYMRYDLASLAKANVLSPTQQLGLLKGMFLGLATVHEHGIIHRDIKPSNILMDYPNGPAMLTDFGISWHEEVNLNEPADDKITDVGTTCYRPPEVLFGNRKYGQKVDMWAAGCTMAEVLRGGGSTLFDAGPISRDDFIGSDLKLISSMFETLGTPTDETWPEAKSFSDWGKITFKEYPARSWSEILPGMDSEARDIIANLVVYESPNRFTAAEVLKYPYFNSS